MIIRPPSDTELLDMIAQIALDGSMQMDTRAMICAIFALRDLQTFPSMVTLQEMLSTRTGEALGKIRLARMVREVKAAGYLIRADWHVRRRRGVPIYTHCLGHPVVIADFVESARRAASARGPLDGR